MVEVRFEDSYKSPRPRVPVATGFSKFLVEHSFGLIKNQTQAIVVQITLCVVFFSVAFILFTDSADNTVSQPSKELLESQQPIGPIN